MAPSSCSTTAHSMVEPCQTDTESVVTIASAAEKHVLRGARVHNLLYLLSSCLKADRWHCAVSTRRHCKEVSIATVGVQRGLKQDMKFNHRLTTVAVEISGSTASPPLHAEWRDLGVGLVRGQDRHRLRLQRLLTLARQRVTWSSALQGGLASAKTYAVVRHGGSMTAQPTFYNFLVHTSDCRAWVALLIAVFHCTDRTIQVDKGVKMRELRGVWEHLE